MTGRRGSLTGVTTHAAPAPSAAELTFPANLLKPQQSQIMQYSDDVADRILQLDMYAKRMGEGFGIPLTSFVLNPRPAYNPSDGVSTTLAILHVCAGLEELISLERRSGVWGLYFVRGMSLFTRERAPEAISLRDAPLDVRERFLGRSQEFFDQYLKLCEDRLGKMRQSVLVADGTIEQLNKVRLTVE